MLPSGSLRLSMVTREEYFAKTPWPGRGQDAGRRLDVSGAASSLALSGSIADPKEPARFAEALSSELRSVACRRSSASSVASSRLLRPIYDVPGAPSSIPGSAVSRRPDGRLRGQPRPFDAPPAMRGVSHPSGLRVADVSSGDGARWQAPTRAALERFSDAGSLRPRSPGTISVGSTIRDFFNDESQWSSYGGAPISNSAANAPQARLPGQARRERQLYGSSMKAPLPPTYEGQPLDLLSQSGRGCR